MPSFQHLAFLTPSLLWIFPRHLGSSQWVSRWLNIPRLYQPFPWAVVFFSHPDVSVWKILFWESCEHSAMNFCKPSLKLHWCCNLWHLCSLSLVAKPSESCLRTWWHLTLEHCRVRVLRTGIFFSVTTSHRHTQKGLWWLASLISCSDDIQSPLLSHEPCYNNFLSLLFESCPVSGCLVSFSSFNPDSPSSPVLFTEPFTTLAFIKGQASILAGCPSIWICLFPRECTFSSDRFLHKSLLVWVRWE